MPTPVPSEPPRAGNSSDFLGGTESGNTDTPRLEIDLASAKTAAAVIEVLALHRVTPRGAAGCAVWDGVAFVEETGGDTALFFDLASLTKPMTALAVARSGMPREAPLAHFVPELAGAPAGAASIEALLAHRAGLLPHLPLYAPLLTGGVVDAAAALRAAACAVSADFDGVTAVYSDLGYLLAGAALARFLGVVDAGLAIERQVVVPLGLEGSLGTERELEARGVRLASRAAPTEVVPFRGGEIRGVVHDENAWALTGSGGSGHAGMFGTVGAVLAFGCAVLAAVRGGEPRLGLSAKDVGWLVTRRPGGTLRAGFDGKSEHGSSVGSFAGASTFGHLGFTGTSLWVDPDAGAVAVLLTNRVHPTRDNERLRAARPFAHDALFRRAAALSTR